MLLKMQQSSLLIPLKPLIAKNTDQLILFELVENGY